MMKSVLTYSADRPPVRRTSATKEFGHSASWQSLRRVSGAFAADVPIRGPGAAPPYMTPTPCYNCNYYIIGPDFISAPMWEPPGEVHTDR